MQLSICSHAVGTILSLENHHSLFKDILFVSICSTRTHGVPFFLDYQQDWSCFRFLKTHLMPKVMKSKLLDSYYLLMELRPCQIRVGLLPIKVSFSVWGIYYLIFDNKYPISGTCYQYLIWYPISDTLYLIINIR